MECVRSVAGGVYFVMQINARLPKHPRYPRRPLLSRRYPRLVRVEVPASGANGQHACVCEPSREHGFRCILGYVQRVPSSPRSLDGYPRIKPAYTLAPLIWCNYYTLRGCTVALSTKLFLFFFFFLRFVFFFFLASVINFVTILRCSIDRSRDNLHARKVITETRHSRE